MPVSGLPSSCTSLFLQAQKDIIQKEPTVSFSLLMSSIYHSCLRKLREVCRRIKLQEWVGKEAEIHVEYVRTVRDWKTWLLARIFISITGY